MSAQEHETDEAPFVDDDDEDEDEADDAEVDDDLEPDISDDVDDDAEDDGGDAAADGEEESLDVLLARDQAVEDEDLLRLDDEPRDGLSVPIDPIGAGEFTCRSCFLVKRRAQLADERKLICFDCA